MIILGLCSFGESLEFFVVDALVLFANPVRNDRVELARKVQRMTVRQMAAVSQVHPQHGVAGFEQREVYAHVRLCARMRLHVGVLGSEQRLGATDCQRFHDVDKLAPTVIATSGIPLGVLVGED